MGAAERDGDITDPQGSTTAVSRAGDLTITDNVSEATFPINTTEFVGTLKSGNRATGSVITGASRNRADAVLAAGAGSDTPDH
jgi:hypothetical protein